MPEPSGASILGPCGRLSQYTNMSTNSRKLLYNSLWWSETIIRTRTCTNLAGIFRKMHAFVISTVGT